MQFAIISARTGASAGDTWEGPAGTPSRVVYSEITFNPANGQITSTLAAATSVTSCAAGDAKILDSKVIPSESIDSFLNDSVQAARFSPDGTRIAYVHGSGGKPRLTTIGFDGSGKRDLSPFQSGGPDAGGLDPDAGIPIGGGEDAPFPSGQLQPRWKDATHVAWVTFVGPTATTAFRSEWELYAVEDREGAKGERLMHCGSSSISSYDFMADGSIIAAVHTRALGNAEPPDDPHLTMNLVIYRANATTKECEVVRRLTQNDAKGAVTRDLALSPDKSTVAFFSGIGDGSSFALSPNNILSLYTSAVDGSRAGQVPGSTGNADPGIGPRWVAGGTAITWGKTNYGAQGMPIGHVASIPAAGGMERTVAQGSSSAGQGPDGPTTELQMVYGMGQGCGIARGAAPTGAFAAGAGLGVAALFVRRRRAGASKRA